jgi:nitroreductase
MKKGESMDFYDVVKTRRSVRSYSSEPVGEEVIKRVLESARTAPSANNVQPWRYIVIKNKERINRIASLASGQMFIAGAPVVIALCGEKYLDRGSWISDNMYLIDTTISMDHLILAARNEGLGTCWIGAFDRKGVEKFLNLPKGIHPIMLTPLGYPKTKTAFSDRTYRREIDQICFLEEYGKSYRSK